MNIFDELQTSLHEAIDIKQGKAKASRVTRHEVADVKAIRTRLHVSQEEFAYAMGTSVDTITEAGKPSAETPRAWRPRYWQRFMTTHLFSMNWPHTD